MTGLQTNCNHAYTKSLSGTELLCLECGEVFRPSEKVYRTDPLVMPPYVYQLTEEYWRYRNPWPRIAREMALKYRWYGSVIFGYEYLVMPVYDLPTSSEPVFYSARLLGGQTLDSQAVFIPPKYYTPKDYKRRIWKSWEIPGGVAGRDFSYILVGEGVADAAYLSQIAPAAALLGSSGELDRPFILVLDGDLKGIEAAFKIVQDAKRRGLVDSLTVILPPGADPTDIPLEKLRKIIYEQTGVRF